MGKKTENIEFVKGVLPKNQKVTYDWESTPKKQFEPWHLTSIALILDVLVLVVYTFVNFSRVQLLTLGYVSHALAIFSIVGSYMMLKSPKKKWSQPVVKFTGMLNITAAFITGAITILTLMLT